MKKLALLLSLFLVFTLYAADLTDVPGLVTIESHSGFQNPERLIDESLTSSAITQESASSSVTFKISEPATIKSLKIKGKTPYCSEYGYTYTILPSITVSDKDGNPLYTLPDYKEFYGDFEDITDINKENVTYITIEFYTGYCAGQDIGKFYDIQIMGTAPADLTDVPGLVSIKSHSGFTNPGRLIDESVTSSATTQESSSSSVTFEITNPSTVQSLKIKGKTPYCSEYGDMYVILPSITVSDKDGNPLYTLPEYKELYGSFLDITEINQENVKYITIEFYTGYCAGEDIGQYYDIQIMGIAPSDLIDIPGLITIDSHSGFTNPGRLIDQSITSYASTQEGSMSTVTFEITEPSTIQSLKIKGQTPYCSDYGYMYSILASLTVTDKDGNPVYSIPDYKEFYGSFEDITVINQENVKYITIEFYTGYCAGEDIGKYYDIEIMGMVPAEISILKSAIGTMFSEENNSIDNTKSLQSDISLYPNPTSGEFSIVMDSNYENGKIEITNISGTVVFTKSISDEKELVDLREQPSGLYFVRVITGQQTVTKKVIIE